MEEALISAKRWDDLILKIGRKEVWIFEGNNVAYANNLIEANCRRLLMRWIYHFLVCKGKLKRFEEMDEEGQADVRNFVNDVCKDREVSEKVKDEIGKVFYTLEYFLNEN